VFPLICHSFILCKEPRVKSKEQRGRFHGGVQGCAELNEIQNILDSSVARI
jgi:hypothetical protein